MAGMEQDAYDKDMAAIKRDMFLIKVMAGICIALEMILLLRPCHAI